MRWPASVIMSFADALVHNRRQIISNHHSGSTVMFYNIIKIVLPPFEGDRQPVSFFIIGGFIFSRHWFCVVRGSWHGIDWWHTVEFMKDTIMATQCSQFYVCLSFWGCKYAPMKNHNIVQYGLGSYRPSTATLSILITFDLSSTGYCISRWLATSRNNFPNGEPDHCFRSCLVLP